MSDTHTYDNTGQRYDINRVLTPDFTLDEEAYKNYSPLFIRLVPVLETNACHTHTDIVQHNLCPGLRSVVRCDILADRLYLPSQWQDYLEAIPQ